MPRLYFLLIVISSFFNAVNAANVQDSCPYISKILSLKAPWQYHEKLKQSLEAITLSSGVLPVGSFRFKEFQFPGDIDIFQNFKMALNKEDAKKYYAQRISNMALRIAANTDLIFSDFKAGKDERLNIDVGYLDEQQRLKGYNYCSIIKDINNLRDSGLIDANEAFNLISLSKEQPTIAEWEDLKENIRLLSTIRWNLGELFAQKKVLRANKIIYLKDALENSLVKIDVFAPVATYGGYTEESTFFNLKYMEGSKENYLTKPMPDYEQSITEEVLFYFEQSHRKSLKAAKRLWILSTIVKDNELTAKLMPLINGPAAALNQIVAESEAIRGILAKDMNLYCSNIGQKLNSQIQTFEKRIYENTNDIPLDLISSKDNGLLRTIFYIFEKDCSDQQKLTTKSKATIQELLISLEKALNPVIESLAADFLRSAKIDPDNPLKTIIRDNNVCPIEKQPQD